MEGPGAGGRRSLDCFPIASSLVFNASCSLFAAPLRRYPRRSRSLFLRTLGASVLVLSSRASESRTISIASLLPDGNWGRALGRGACLERIEKKKKKKPRRTSNRKNARTALPPRCGMAPRWASLELFFPSPAFPGGRGRVEHPLWAPLIVRSRAGCCSRARIVSPKKGRRGEQSSERGRFRFRPPQQKKKTEKKLTSLFFSFSLSFSPPTIRPPARPPSAPRSPSGPRTTRLTSTPSSRTSSRR